MRRSFTLSGRLLAQGSLIALSIALAGPAAAADEAGKPDQAVSEVVVTGSLIQRQGFDAPTPTTVITDADLRVGDRPTIGELLDDQPQFRTSATPTTTTSGLSIASVTLDLRGLGGSRTLVLLDGHRFIGSTDLGTIPQSLVRAVDVVTGGASAAWGSDAVSGVVNILTNDRFTGVELGVDGGSSSRNDSAREGFHLTAGSNFLDGRGHVMIAGDLQKADGAFDRTSRPYTIAQIFQDASGQLSIQAPVNYTILNTGGVIIGGKANQMVFNHDGSLSPLVLGNPTAGNFTVGGGGVSPYQFLAITSPYRRANVFSKASLDLDSNTKVWADFSYDDITSNFPFVPVTPVVSIKADNPFLTAGARAQLAALGATLPLTVGRIITDAGPTGITHYASDRQTYDLAVGIDGALGGKWTYSAHYDHGEERNNQSVGNQQITANFANAIDAVAGPGGTPICRANLVTVTAPGCVPINILGSGNISPAAVAYAFGANQQINTTKLDSAALILRGTPLSSWAGPVDVVGGLEYRKQSLTTNYIDPISLAGGFTTLNWSPLNGSISVKEAFGELNVPVFDRPDVLHVEVNGAARYSDYSTSGGIWSWKYGATARIQQDLLLRGTYSRDIRSPGVSELYSTKGTQIQNALDPFTGQSQVGVVSFTGGNPNLVPEIGHTLTLGGSYSPHYIEGLRVSVDYYDIDISGALASLSLQDTLNVCFKSNPNDPGCGGVIVRNPNGTINYALRTTRNLADYHTKGVDFEASYVTPLSRLVASWPGDLRLHYLGNYTQEVIINTGPTITDVAGVVGDGTSFDTPKWRHTATASYDHGDLSLDLRLRYVGGGLFSLLKGPNGKPLSNNDVAPRTYTDIGAHYQIRKATLFVSVDNLFDTKPPPVTNTTPWFDVIGRYYSGGVKVRF